MWIAGGTEVAPVLAASFHAGTSGEPLTRAHILERNTRKHPYYV
jgi:hypothetical protein